VLAADLTIDLTSG